MKAQFASLDMKQRSPTSTAEKGFMFGSGKLVVEASLDREVFYHGEDLPIHISINNNSKKCVKNIRVSFHLTCNIDKGSLGNLCGTLNFYILLGGV